MQEAEVVPLEVAMALLKIRDEGERRLVHTFLVTSRILFGADMDLDEVLEVAAEYGGIRQAGPGAQQLGHGLVIQRPDAAGSSIFLETKPV